MHTTYVVHKGAAAMAEILPAWGELADRPGTHIFQTPAFAESWMDTVGAKQHATPLIVTRSGGGKITALFGACLVNEGPIRLATWLGGPHMLDYGDILLDPSTCDVPAEQFVADSLEQLRPHMRGATLYLTNVRDDALCGPALRSSLCTYKTSAAPYIVLEGTYAEYMTSLGKKRRHNLERLQRKLERCGEVRFEMLGGDDPRFAEALHALIELQERRYASWHSAPIFGPYCEAFRVAHALRDPCVTLGRLTLDGGMVAGSLQCVRDGRLYYLVTAFDEARADCAPGRCLTLKLLEHAFAAGVRIFDFCWGAQPYKYEWTSVHEPLHTYVDRSPGGRLLTATGKLRQALVSLGEPSC